MENKTGHSKSAKQLEFAVMLHKLMDIPIIKFRKRYKQLRLIRKFAQQHKDCCEIEWK